MSVLWNLGIFKLKKKKLIDTLTLKEVKNYLAIYMSIFPVPIYNWGGRCYFSPLL